MKSNREGTRLTDLSRDEIIENFEYYDGDQWLLSIFKQKAREVTDKKQLKRLEAIGVIFQSPNKVEEVVSRHVQALLEETPAWDFVDLNNKALDNVPFDLDIQLKNFLRSQERLSASMFAGRGSRQCLKKAVTDAVICGKGYLRLYNPQKFGISLVIHSPDPLQVKIGRDYNGFPNWVKYSYREDDKTILTEHQSIDAKTGLTIFRTLKNDSDYSGDYRSTEGFIEADVIDQWSLDLNRSFSVYEFRLAPLINKSVKRAQNGINGILTLALNNILYTIPRDSVMNGLPPGEFRTSPSGQLEYQTYDEVEDATPGSTTYISGYPIFDEDKAIAGYTTPTIFTHEPFSTEYFLKTYEVFKRGIYESAHQGFVLRNQDSQLSGVAHKVLKSDFNSALKADSLVVTEGIRNFYMTSLFMLNQGQQTIIKNLKGIDLVVELHIASGDVLPEDKRSIREDYQAGLVSQFTAINMLGYDPEFEVPKIEEENQLLQEIPSNPLAALDSGNVNPEQPSDNNNHLQ